MAREKKGSGRKYRGGRGRFKKALDALDQLDSIEKVRKSLRKRRKAGRIRSVEKSSQRFKNACRNLRDSGEFFDEFT